MIYLKISLSDFFTVFAARCRWWYVSLASAVCLPGGQYRVCVWVGVEVTAWMGTAPLSGCRFFERRPGYALTAALVVATGTSTLFSLFWPFPPDEYKTLNMGKLANAKYGAIFVWLYVLLWFLVQDAAKVLSYALMRNFTVGKEREVDVRLVHGKIRAAIDTENRNERIRGLFYSLSFGLLSCRCHWVGVSVDVDDGMCVGDR